MSEVWWAGYLVSVCELMDIKMGDRVFLIALPELGVSEERGEVVDIYANGTYCVRVDKEFILHFANDDGLREVVGEQIKLLSRLEWRPAETAPRDYEPFMAYGENLINTDYTTDGIVEAFWTDDNGFVGTIWNNVMDCWQAEPITFTHWLRLSPPAPLPPTGT